MPRYEQLGPWKRTAAADTEPYPRKNVYFVGDGMTSVYDYCTWRANVVGYLTLDGTPARGMSEMIADVLKRQYLHAMLDEREAAEFQRWRREEYEKDNDLVEPIQESPEVCTTYQRVSDDWHSSKMVHQNGRSKRQNAAIVDLFEKQSGRCANCGQKRILRLGPTTKITTTEHIKSRQRSLPANAVLLCSSCHRAAQSDAQHERESSIAG